MYPLYPSFYGQIVYHKLLCSANEDKVTLSNLEDIVKSIDDRIDDIEEDDKLVGSIQGWKIQFQEYCIRQAMLMRELTERRDEIKSIFDVIDISGGQNKALVNRISTLSTRIDNRHRNVPDIVDNAKYEAILGESKRSGSDDEDDGYATDASQPPDTNEDESKVDYAADLREILENVAGFHKENEDYRRFMGVLKAVKCFISL